MNWVIVLVLLFPSLTLAQDGSAPPQDAGSASGGADSGSVPPVTNPVAPSDPAPAEALATSSTPTPVTPRPTPTVSATSAPASPSATTAPSVANAPVPNPVVTPSAPVPVAISPTIAPTEPEDDTTNPLLLPILAALAVIPFGFLVAGALKKKKVKKADDEGGRCFDVKTMLDKKLEELTDLKGKLQSKATGVAKEKIRESVQGTSAGEMLAVIEKAEKEYGRLKKLYEDCMIEVDGRTRVIILHGCPSDEQSGINPVTRTYDKHWMPWARSVLQSRKIKVEMPLMPAPWAPDYEKFKAEFEKQKVDEKSILVAHSCGCAFIVRWLGETKQKVAKLILVAPWKVGKPGDAGREKFYVYPIDPTIKDRVGKIVMFTSDDEKADGKRSLQMFHDVLGGEIVELPGRGHYTLKNMKTEQFPELIDEVLR